MVNYSPDDLRAILENEIATVSANRVKYVTDSSHHTRKRKLSFPDVIRTVLNMSGGSINNELLNLYNCSEDTPTASAFVQQRSKILSTAFESIFHGFVNKTSHNHTYKGYRLLAVDGSDLHIPTNPDDPASYFPRINDQRPYNLLHLNAMFDLCSGTYIDAVIQKNRHYNEIEALIEMLHRFSPQNPVIIIADRGYEAYNALAHIQEKGWNYLFRIKNSCSKGGIAHGLDLPTDEEYDVSIDLHLSAGRTKEHRLLYKDKNKYKRVSHPEYFDFFKNSNGTFDVHMFYSLPFRIIKFKLKEGIYETIITNLPTSSFSTMDIKHLYKMRWDIETSFRQLKYTLGLLNFHSKKLNSVYQEIYAHLTMYNFIALVISHHRIVKKSCKHSYKSSFSIAIHACRDFLRRRISQESVIKILTKYLTPIRPGRKAPRRKKKDRSIMSFNYRVS